MSAPSPVTDWLRLGLRWGYVTSQVLSPFVLAGGYEKQLPTEDFTFKYPEGVLLHFTAGFDHPLCGLRLEFNPELDTQRDFTVSNVALGVTLPDPLIYATVPPRTPPGLYGLRIVSQWHFQDWARLYVFNNDIIPHKCIAFLYHMLVLKEPRPNERITPLKDMARVQQMLELYPELREPMRKRYADEAEQFIKDMNLKIRLEAS